MKKRRSCAMQEIVDIISSVFRLIPAIFLHYKKLGTILISDEQRYSCG